MINRIKSHLLIFLVAVHFSSWVWSDDNHESDLADSSSYEEDLAEYYGGEEYVSIATGSEQLLSRAPAVASVITEKDIARIGATDLNEILETVPGLHVSVSSQAYNPIFQIRGIHSEFNPQVLMLINGIRVTNVFAGNRSIVWGGMPVNNIARVEVIRGPGSAVYGADAFAGVINIITKTASDMDGLDIGFRAGEFALKEGWLQYGGNLDELEVAFSFQAGDTNGQRRTVGADAQSFFDQSFGTNASLAPGPVNVGRRYVDTRLDLTFQNWQLRVGFQGRDRVGAGVGGGAQALDPVGESTSTRFNTDLTYQNTDAFKDWDITAQLSFFDVGNESDLRLFPPGSAFPDNMNVLRMFPNGVIGNPDSFERHYRASLSGLYHGFRGHQLRVDAGFRFEDLYKIKETKNFDQPGPFPIPLPGGLTDVSKTAPFLTPQNRKVVYVFAQDEWNFSPDWTLTAGLRYDHYSDFGSTVNPRVALVWQTSYNLTSKLLYGRAFRAPSFTEQFSVNNPVAQGNANLDPETINTVELAFDYQATSDLHTNLNVFWYEYEDIIRLLPMSQGNQFQNAGDQYGYGLELEAQWKVFRDLQLQANYALQISTDDTTDQDVGFAPTHQLYGRADWQFWPSWNLDVQANWVADRKRPPMDLRTQVENYVTLDMTLRGENIFHNWGVSASVRNLFNTNALEPSQPFPNPNSSLIPGDLPLAGRSFYFELRYRLQ